MCRSRFVFVAALIVLATACSSTTRQPGASATGADAHDPLAAITLMDQGQAMVAQGRFEEGLQRYSAALRLQSTNPTIFNLIGVARLRAGEPAKAVEAFTRALTLAPTYSDARNNRGAAYVQLNQFSEAEGDFLAVLSDSTYANRAGVLFNLGSLEAGRGNLQAGREYLRRATLMAGAVDAYLLLGQVESKLGKRELAEIALRAGLDRAPERVDIRLALADLLESEGRQSEARDFYQMIIAQAPGSREAAAARLKLAR
jgi:tetratricopeptide (TPR) repeat protein